MLARLARTADAIADRIEPPAPLRALIAAVQPTIDVQPAPRPSPPPKAEPPAAPPPPPLSYRMVEHLGTRIGPRLAVLRQASALGPADAATVDPDQLRQLRVASRRLRAFVTLFAPTIGDKRARRLNRQLRRITRALGPVRDRQAHADLLAAARSDAGGDLERAAIEHMSIDVDRDATATIELALRAVSKADPGAIADAIAEQLDLVSARMLQAGDELAPLVWPALAQRVERFMADLPSRDPSGDLETLHEVRIRAKRMRYALELVRPMLGEQDRPTRRIAKKVQRTLGQWGDATRLSALTLARADALQAQGHTVLAKTLRGSAQRVDDRRRAAIEAAVPWMVQFDPIELTGRLAQAFGAEVPAWARPRAEPEAAPVDEAANEPPPGVGDP